MSDAPKKPAPLVPPEVDLRGYGFMPFHGDKCFKSASWGTATSPARIAMLRLWWQAWAHEIPAASLPSDEVLLAGYAGYDRNVASWRKVSEQALRGFVLCSDGRLYHGFLAPLAMEAWERRKRDREKKRRFRDRDGTGTSPEGGTVPETGTGRPRERGEGEREGKGPTPPPFVLPDWVPERQWLDYLEMRAKIRKPMTSRAKELAVLELAKLRGIGQDPGAVLEQSVLNSWQGIYPLKNGGGTSPQGKQSGVESRNKNVLDSWRPPK